MNKLLSKSGQIQYGMSEFLINTDDEVSTLPLNVPVGSSAMSMATGTFFFLRKEGNQLKWLPVDGGGSGTSDYSQLTNKPTINGVELNGALSTDDLGFAPIATSGDYNDLSGAPWTVGEGDYSVQLTDSGSRATGDYATAEGQRTRAFGNGSHTEGVASGTISPNTSGAIPEWRDGYAAHAEGHLAEAGGRASHAEGDNTITNNPGEHAEGRYNVSNYVDNSEYGNAGNTQHSVGIGTNEFNHKNAFEIMQNGDAYMLGIGNYDGTNIENASTVQDTINDKLSLSLAWGKETHGAVDSGAITLPSVENTNIINELTYIFSATSANLSITAPSGYILGDDSGFAGLSAGNTIAYTNLTVGSIYEMSFKVLDRTHIGMVKKEWKTA